MTRDIQQWMIVVKYKLHPETDNKKHPKMEANYFG